MRLKSDLLSFPGDGTLTAIMTDIKPTIANHNKVQPAMFCMFTCEIDIMYYLLFYHELTQIVFTREKHRIIKGNLQ